MPKQLKISSTSGTIFIPPPPPIMIPPPPPIIENIPLKTISNKFKSKENLLNKSKFENLRTSCPFLTIPTPKNNNEHEKKIINKNSWWLVK